jgi:hypothetical protein
MLFEFSCGLNEVDKRGVGKKGLVDSSVGQRGRI